MRKEFENPGAKYRPIPFWSWNYKLDPEELKYQIKEMKKVGMGGYFMHARSGLKTEYLSDEWFECIKAGIEQGRESNIDAWIYDEEGWPSGFAGGLVPALDKDYYAKYISLKELKTTKEIDWSITLAAFVFDNSSNTYFRINEGCDYSASDYETILQIIRNENPFYIDTMNKRAVDAFIKVTHEEYYKRFKDDFGSGCKGFFTDEPRLTCDYFLDLAWSDDYPDEFKKTYGYDIIGVLPALYKECEGYRNIRYQFWCLVNEMFVKNYMKNIYDWCQEHNCKSTGHIMMEESIFSQMTSTAGVMPFYEYEHIPGIDWLRRNILSPVVPKQVGSVACQLGRKQVLTESFALCGWDVSFEELKQIAEWQFVNGVNQICQHLEAYTIKGSRKRDYPPSLFLQQTWWEKYKLFNDFLARECYVLSIGDQMADVLLLHPMRSGYVLYNGTRTDEIRKLDEDFTQINNELTGLHISYHLGDETIISKHGRVENGILYVGKIPYKSVIMPHMESIDSVTLNLLLQFITEGGHVFSVGKYPVYTNGSEMNLNSLACQVIKTDSSLLRKRMLEEGLIYAGLEEDGQEASDISLLLRSSKDEDILFFVNLSKEKEHNTKLRIFNKHVSIEQMVCEDGTICSLPVVFDGPDTVVNNLYFAPMQSYMLMIKKTESINDVQIKDNAMYISCAEQWKIVNMDMNSMTLDMCEYRIDGGNWQPECAVILLQNKLLELRRPCKADMRFHFNIGVDIDKCNNFFCVIEDSPLYNISVNGQDIDNTPSGYWKDKFFNKVDIKDYVIKGENEIILSIEFKQPQKVYDVLFGDNVYETEKNKITYDVEIESIYLLGDFGVISKSPFIPGERKALVTNGPFEIVGKPTMLNSCNFTEQGLLFFAGSMELEQKLFINKTDNRRLILKLDRQKVPIVSLKINGKDVKSVLWAPYEVDITDCVSEGINDIKLKVYTSNRNLLGPHHNINGECYNVGPETFTGKWSWCERITEADATEIYDTEKDYWTDSYCFVETGLK